ncbi:MAG: DUF4440 domain-containing protein [bacterium]
MYYLAVGLVGLLLGFLGGQLAAFETSISHEDLKLISKSCLDKWLDMLKQADPDAIADLYDKDGTLHPTFGVDLRKGETLRDYFAHFFKKKPLGKIIENEIQSITDFCHVDSGEYHFEVVNSEGDKEVVEARFSFVFKAELEGIWKKMAKFLSKFSILKYIVNIANRKIYSHHSSEKPRGH